MLELLKFLDTLLIKLCPTGKHVRRTPPGCFYLFSEYLHLTLGHWMPVIVHLEYMSDGIY